MCFDYTGVRMKDTLFPEERLALCYKLLNRTGYYGADPKCRKDALDAVFEIVSFGSIQLNWLKLVQSRCGLEADELEYYFKAIKLRTE